jgi:hypothetical protein
MTFYFNRNLPGLVILVALLCFALVVNAADVQSDENVPLSKFSHSQVAKRILPKAPNLLLLKHYEPGQYINGWLKKEGVRSYITTFVLVIKMYLPLINKNSMVLSWSSTAVLWLLAVIKSIGNAKGLGLYVTTIKN